MIVAKLQHGLGNQLFQWAVTRNLSIKYNTEYFFDTHFYSMPGSRRQMLLTQFPHIKIDKPNFDYFSLPRIKEVAQLIDLPDNVYIDGYWQSEKYFVENKKTIVAELQPSTEIKDYIFKKYPVLHSNTVSMHVRRSDYLVHTCLLHSLPLDYYTKSYDVLQSPDINVLIFSDDIKWCKQNLKFKNQHFVENESEIVDLYTMSFCQHNIIANSTFSWWAAWINSNSKKTVIAPNLWFKDHICRPNVVPDRWIKI